MSFSTKPQEIRLSKFRALTAAEQLAYCSRSQTADFDQYSPRIAAIIGEIHAAGQFPYNSHVATRAEAEGLNGPGLSMLVYNSHQYYDTVASMTRIKLRIEELTREGFVLLTTRQEQLVRMAEGGELYEIYLTPSQLITARIKRSATLGLLWMEPRASRNGYAVMAGNCYVRLKPKNPKPLTASTGQLALG